MTRIAVLGGTGCTGSAIAGEAAARGHDVVVRSRSALTDEQGASAISGADLGRAVVDEIEQRQHRGHIGVAH